MSEASRTSPPTPVALPAGDWLPEQDGHRVWWAEGGDPAGRPVLVIHGGPGGASRVEPTTWFAGLPVRWIVIDQRGCGRSTPPGATPHNDLPALLADMERLRERLGLDRWSLAGGSWGARVALAYVARWPARVDGLFLRSPFTGSVAETRRYIAAWPAWLGDEGRAWLGGAAADAVTSLFQDATAGRPPAPIAGDERVAQAWSAYDDLQSKPGGVAASSARFSAAAMPAATPALRAGWCVHAHYAMAGWGSEAGDPDALPLLQDRPVAVVWGEADASCDPAVARALLARLPKARGTAVTGAGHRMSDPRLAPALAAAARDWIAALAAYSGARQRSLR